jgi:hypothetical protein
MEQKRGAHCSTTPQSQTEVIVDDVTMSDTTETLFEYFEQSLKSSNSAMTPSN